MLHVTTCYEGYRTFTHNMFFFFELHIGLHLKLYIIRATLKKKNDLASTMTLRQSGWIFRKDGRKSGLTHCPVWSVQCCFNSSCCWTEAKQWIPAVTVALVRGRCSVKLSWNSVCKAGVHRGQLSCMSWPTKAPRISSHGQLSWVHSPCCHWYYCAEHC